MEVVVAVGSGSDGGSARVTVVFRGNHSMCSKISISRSYTVDENQFQDPEIDEENTDFYSYEVGCPVAKRSKEFLSCHSILTTYFLRR